MNDIKKILYKFKPTNLCDSFLANFVHDYLVVYWSYSKGGTHNFGDVLNPYLIQKISGNRCVNYKDIYLFRDKKVFTCIGSVLNQMRHCAVEVWGSGFIKPTKHLPYSVNTIHAVRGPLTREVFQKLGIACPEIYGDPAILLPAYYHPAVEKKYKVGIVPHYSDLTSSHLQRFLEQNPDVHLVDVRLPVERFVDELLACDFILSSSLHGLIMADAYYIPNVRIIIENRLVGGDFKFRDYYESNGRSEGPRLRLADNPTLEQIQGAWKPYKQKIDREQLLLSCPFYEASLAE